MSKSLTLVDGDVARPRATQAGNRGRATYSPFLTSPRRKSLRTRGTPVGPQPAQGGSSPSHQRANAVASTTYWRRNLRWRTLCQAVSATSGLTWSTNLLKVLLEELHIGDDVEQLFDATLSHLPQRDYPRAVAAALILRHSWREDDLASIVERLELRNRKGRRRRSVQSR